MVTDENFGELLIEGLEEIAAHRRGELPAAKVVRRLRLWGEGEGWDNGGEDDPEDSSGDQGLRNRLRP